MKKILIIDDAATVRLYHKALMEKSGFIVDEAVNGIEALEKLADFGPDMCLVDVNMPKMDGYRFTETLRESTDFAHIPVVMISTEEEEHDRIKAFAAGANHYIVKPAKQEQLSEVAQLMLGAA